MGTSGLMSGDGKRGGVSASAPALVLDSTTLAQGNPEAGEIEEGAVGAILMPPEYDEWLDRGEAERPPTHLLRPFPETTLQIHPAITKVGNVRNQGIDLLDPP